MGKYRTRQQDRIEAYLRDLEGRHVTAGEIVKHFAKEENPISSATVYRHLQRMVDSGLVRKYNMEPSEPACYVFVKEGTHDQVHFHCKCINCGRLLHVDCAYLRGIEEHILVEHAFQIDPNRTCFYGLCKECQ